MRTDVSAALLGFALALGCGTEAPSPRLGSAQQALSAPARLIPLDSAPNPVASIILGPVGDKVLLVAGDTAHGNEPWIADGDGGSASLLRDLWPGPGYATTTNVSFAALGGEGFFFADDGAHGMELWKTDGTTAGTVMVRDLAPGQASLVNTGTSAVPMASTANAIYFAATDGLWRSDGTAEGTVHLAGFGSGQTVTALTSAGASVYFTLNDQLYASDGTDAGTRVVDGGLGLSSLANLTAIGGSLYFSAFDSSNGSRARKLDSPTSPPVVLSSDPSFTTAPAAVGFTSWDGGVYFLLPQAGGGGTLWRTDGTSAGSGPVTTDPSLFPRGQALFAGAGAGLFIAPTVDAPGPYPLLVTDGTDAGTVGVAQVAEPIGSIAAFHGGVVFTSAESTNNGTWFSDGTDAGTWQLTPVGQASAAFLVQGDRVFFEGNNQGGSGANLQCTDGTPAGTHAVPGFTAQLPTYSVLSLVRVGDRLLLPINSTQLWTTDGTSSGTELLVPGLSFVGFSQHLALANDAGYFVSFNTAKLYRTDGTPAGTVQLPHVLPTGANLDVFAVVGSRVLLRAGTQQLWVAEEDAGVHLFTGINPDGGCNPRYPTNFGDRVYFYADSNGTSGAAGYYVTDGTDPGTQLINPVGYYPGGPHTAQAGGVLYFQGTGPSPYFSSDLWRTDGTDPGTFRVAALNNPFATTFDAWLTAAGGSVYYGGGSPTTGVELYAIDGTTGVVSQVKDLNPGRGSANPTRLAEWNGRLLFLGDDGTGRKMWVTDGTSQGTTLVTDVLTGYVDYNNPANDERIFAVPGGPILFPGGDGLGNELWASDGTAQGTERVADLYPGVESSSPAAFAQLGGRVYFVATTADGGAIWSVGAGAVGGGTGSDAGSGTGADAGSGTGADAGSGTGADAGSATGADAGSATGADAGGIFPEVDGGAGSGPAPTGCGCGAAPAPAALLWALAGVLSRRRR